MNEQPAHELVQPCVGEGELGLGPRTERGLIVRKLVSFEQSVIAAEEPVASKFRMGHQPKHVAPLVTDAGDVIHRAVGVGSRRSFSFGIDVA